LKIVVKRNETTIDKESRMEKIRTGKRFQGFEESRGKYFENAELKMQNAELKDKDGGLRTEVVFRPTGLEYSV